MDEPPAERESHGDKIQDRKVSRTHSFQDGAVPKSDKARAMSVVTESETTLILKAGKAGAPLKSKSGKPIPHAVAVDISKPTLGEKSCMASFSELCHCLRNRDYDETCLEEAGGSANWSPMAELVFSSQVFDDDDEEEQEEEEGASADFPEQSEAQSQRGDAWSLHGSEVDKPNAMPPPAQPSGPRAPHDTNLK